MAHPQRGARALTVLLAASMCLMGGRDIRPAPSPVARRALAAATLNGLVFVAGGWNGDATQLARVDAYEPGTQGWRAAPPLAIARSQHSLVAARGRLWAVAGWSAERGLVPELESWAPGEAAWRMATHAARNIVDFLDGRLDPAMVYPVPPRAGAGSARA